MSDKAISTPHSVAEEPSGPKYPAVKDKNCPFCHQAFTSSSLGRHLDLYIKPKNPKPPDGIHIVDEIRRIRGNITRRHPRNSTSLKKEDGTPGPKAGEHDDDGSPIADSPTSLNMSGDGKVRSRFSDTSWQGPGVLNSLTRPTLNVPERGRSASRQVQRKAEFEQRQKSSEDWINGKAAELALREILNSVKEATARTTGLGLYDFDPFALNFPSLCLHILPPPSTLFSPTPFATTDSWSITPPGQRQFEALIRHVKERIAAVNCQRHQPSAMSLAPPGYNSAANSPLPTPPLLHDIDGSKILSHVQEAYQHWKTLPEKQRQEAWQLEVLRCYVRRGETCKQLENRLEVTEREMAQLKTSPWLQFGMDPVEYAQMTLKAYSVAPQVSVDTVRELSKQGVNVTGWDYEQLLEKWRGVVKEQRKVSSGLHSQRSLSACSSNMTPHALFNSNGSGSVKITTFQQINAATTEGGNSNGMSQPTSAATTGYSTAPTSDSMMDDDGADQADGEGEDEDAEAEDDAGASPEDFKLSTPSHPSHRPQLQSQPSQQQLHQQQQQQQQQQQMHQHHIHQQQQQQQQQHHHQQQQQQQQQQQHQHHQHQHQVIQAWAQHNMSHHQHNQALQHQHIAQHMNGRGAPMLVDTPVMMTMDGMDGADPDSFLDRGMTLNMGSLAESYAQLAGAGGN